MGSACAQAENYYNSGKAKRLRSEQELTKVKGAFFDNVMAGKSPAILELFSVMHKTLLGHRDPGLLESLLRPIS
jgi:hypothetical protein